MASAIVQKSCLRGHMALRTECQNTLLTGSLSARCLVTGPSGQLRSVTFGHASSAARGSWDCRKSVVLVKPLGLGKLPVASNNTRAKDSARSQTRCGTQRAAHSSCSNETALESTVPPPGSLDESPRPPAWTLFVQKLPKLLCLAALCSLLVFRSRQALAANGAAAVLVRPTRVARFSLLATLVHIKEAFRVASAGELLASAWTGLVAGCLHTLTGPDHLAALAPMSIGRTRLQSAWMGALWGCGHDAGQLLFGLLFLLLKERLHMDLLSQWSGVVIGVTLCGIGALGLHESRQLGSSEESPSPEDRPPTPAFAGVSTVGASDEHRPDDVATAAQRGTASSGKPFGVATFVTGIFHGFQPDALIMILPALALPSKLAGLSFLVTFLLGTILAMGSYTAFIGASCEVLGERVPWINEKLSQVSSTISILVGVALISSNAFGFKIL